MSPPRIPEQWPARHANKAPNQGHSEVEAPDAAQRAMQPVTQALAGSAEGVGSVDFDDPGAFDVTEQSRRAVEPIRPEDAPAVEDGGPPPKSRGPASGKA